MIDAGSEHLLIFPRQTSGFTSNHESGWRRWHNEDTAFASQAAVTAKTPRQVRSALTLPQ
jgi:hypothetical protein